MKKLSTRERLLQVAMELIWAESYGTVGVEEICRKTRIQKGSFYHFFSSKAALADAALRDAWQRHQPNLERLFSREVDPIERLMNYFDYSIQKQKELREQFGFYPGCPFTSIGMEQGRGQGMLRQTAEEHLNYVKRYFEITISDAVEEGVIKPQNATVKADEVFSLYLGAFARLRIANNIAVMMSVKEGALALLGVQTPQTGPARKKKRRVLV